MDRDPANYPEPAPMSEPLPVECVEGTQAGYKYLAGTCPRCGRPHHVAKEGKAACPCGAWLAFRPKAQ